MCLQIDGRTLLMLTENDLREKPLEMSCLGDIKRLSLAITKLKATVYPVGNGFMVSPVGRHS